MVENAVVDRFEGDQAVLPEGEEERRLNVLRKTLPVSRFLPIVDAGKVEGKLRNTQFTLSDYQMAALRDFASRRQP